MNIREQDANEMVKLEQYQMKVVGHQQTKAMFRLRQDHWFAVNQLKRVRITG